MKPTQEQVIAWYEQANGWSPEGWDKTVEELERFAALAYEAGRKDEREWQGLTDEEVFAALVAVDGNTKRLAPGFVSFYCAIEAKLKEKNT